ncbi:hypothetical protein D3C84_730990 [compost metagenome]
MNRIQWFSVPNPEHKRYPEWRRTFGISDDSLVFVPAAMAGDESEFNVMLCAHGDLQPTAVHLDHHFVPSGWLKREFPKHLELIEMIEARARELTASEP